jgi:hypothetical protein
MVRLNHLARRMKVMDRHIINNQSDLSRLPTPCVSGFPGIPYFTG